MPADDALLLALVIAGLIVLLAGKRRRTQLFGAVLTKGKKGRLDAATIRQDGPALAWAASAR